MNILRLVRPTYSMLKTEIRTKLLSNNNILNTNKKELKETDIFVASYPRSGNTWTRLLLSDVMLQVLGFETDVKLPIVLGKISPDNTIDLISEIDPKVLELPFRLIKTHERYDGIRGYKAIHIFRNPADSLTSEFQLKKRKNPEYLADFYSDPDVFCRFHVSVWSTYMKTYIEAKEKNPERLMFVSYETLHEKPVEAVKKMTEFMGLDATMQMCANAVEHHRIEKKQELAGNSQFFRKGKVGSAREELPGETVDYIESKGMGMYDRAKQLEAMI